MLEIKSSGSSSSVLVTEKGSRGYSVGVVSPIQTLFGVHHNEAVKNLTHEEAMQLRDDLNKHYPLNYIDITTVEFEELRLLRMTFSI